MQKFNLILILAITLSGLAACSGGDSQPDLSAVQDIVVVDGDTLGRNWDNLPTKEEVEKAKELGISPEQYKQLVEQEKMRVWEEAQQANNALNAEGEYSQEFNYDEYYKFEPTEFSEKMHREETYTVITADGREVVVGSEDKRLGNRDRGPGQ